MAGTSEETAKGAEEELKSRSGDTVPDPPPTPDAGSASIQPEDFLVDKQEKKEFNYFDDIEDEEETGAEEKEKEDIEEGAQDTEREEEREDEKESTVSDEGIDMSLSDDELLTKLDEELEAMSTNRGKQQEEDSTESTPDEPEKVKGKDSETSSETAEEVADGELSEAEFEKLSQMEQVDYLVQRRLGPIQKERSIEKAEKEFSTLLDYFAEGERASVQSMKPFLDSVRKEVPGITYVAAYMIADYNDQHRRRYLQGLRDGMKRAQTQEEASTDTGVSSTRGDQLQPANEGRHASTWDEAVKLAEQELSQGKKKKRAG